MYEPDFGARPVERELQDQVEQLSAAKHDRQERSVHEVATPVKHYADDC